MQEFGTTYPPWTRIILIPIWMIQLALLPVTVLLLTTLICITDPGVKIWNIIYLVIASLVLVITCVEVVVFRHMDLTPKFFLLSSIGKLVLWSATVALGTFDLTTDWSDDKYNRIYMYVVTGFTNVVFVSLLGSLGYSIWVFRKEKKRVKGVVEGYMAAKSTELTEFPRHRQNV